MSLFLRVCKCRYIYIYVCICECMCVCLSVYVCFYRLVFSFMMHTCMFYCAYDCLCKFEYYCIYLCVYSSLCGFLSLSFFLSLSLSLSLSGPENLGPWERFTRKTPKIILGASLLNAQYNKVWIKGKWSNPLKWVVPSPTFQRCSH